MNVYKATAIWASVEYGTGDEKKHDFVKHEDHLKVVEKLIAPSCSAPATGSVSLGMGLPKALQILERSQEAMGHAKVPKFSDAELIAILTYRQAMRQNA